MPRRLILSATERDTLLALPESQDDLIRYYTFNDSDLSLIRQRRGDANRLGFAVQLCSACCATPVTRWEPTASCPSRSSCGWRSKSRPSRRAGQSTASAT